MTELDKKLAKAARECSADAVRRTFEAGRPITILVGNRIVRRWADLFMAGRNISVTHVALGATRVMRTTGMIGEVVGMAASVCKAHGCRPRAVYEKHFDELKALMTRGVGTGKPQPPQDYYPGEP